MLKRTAGSWHRAAAVLAGLVAVLAIATTVQARGNAPVETYTFEVPGDWSDFWGERRFDAAIYRWSTQHDRERVYRAMANHGPDGLRQLVRGSPFAGRITLPGGLTYSLGYAYRATRADGGQDVVLISDQRAWTWWDRDAGSGGPDYPFTVFHLRLDADGSGEGKASLTASVVADERTGVAVADFARQAAVLLDVRREGEDARG